MRKPYNAACNFFADGSTADNRINWYIVPDDAPRYKGLTAFYPRVIHPADQAHTVYEREGAGRTVRRFTTGLEFLPPPPHDAHGDPEDFQGLSPMSKYFVDDVPPDAPCVVFHVRLVGLKLGGDVVSAAPARPAGVKLGAALVPRPIPVLRAGIALGARAVKPVTKLTAGVNVGAALPLPLRPGLALGATVTPAPSSTPAGLALGGVPVLATPAARRGGFALGGQLEAPALELLAGLSVGGRVASPSIAVVHDAGVELGGQVQRGPGATHDAGIELGGATEGTAATHDAGVELGGDVVDDVGTLGGGAELGGDLVAP